jgi:hypothetical protein
MRNLQDKIRKEELAFKAYATERLQEAYPTSERVIQLVAVDPRNGRRRLSAWIDGWLAFGAGFSNAEAVDRLVRNSYPRISARQPDLLEKKL